MMILPKVLESDPWGETPKPPDWLVNRLQADGCVPRHPLQIRFIQDGRGRFALDGSQIGSCVGDRGLRSVKLALLDRNPLRCGNAKRPLSFIVTSIGGGSGEAGRPPTGDVGEAPPRFGFTDASKERKPIFTKELTALTGLDFFLIFSS
jgi:hypothetical protein